MAREAIKQLVKGAIKKLQKKGVFPVFNIPEINISHPGSSLHGDYSTNIAMSLAGLVKKNPLEIAENLKCEMQSKIIDRIETAGPGFVNFFLSKEYLQGQVAGIIIQGGKFGQLSLGKNKKIQVEFISANPTGPLTVGNARGGPFGDTLANVLKAAGFKTEKAYYVNDYGSQILTLGHSVLKDKEAQYKGQYIDDLNKKIKEKDPYKAGKKAALLIIKTIKKTAAKMGIQYDEWLFESSLYKNRDVDKTLEALKKKKLLYEKDGAVWFKATQFEDQRDRVVVKSDGAKTYLAGDIAHHRYKFEKKKFDKVIDVWGADHSGDVAGLQSGISAFGHKGKLDIPLLQFVTLIEKKEKVKMSKRQGTFVTMDELLSVISPDVVRFFFLQKSAGTHLNFDLDLAKEQSEKNPVFYIQYAHARICSILRKSPKYKLRSMDYAILDHSSELDLIKQLICLPEIVEDTAHDYQIQRLTQYSLDLASSFHKFYRDCRVVSEDKNLTQARLSLILATKNVLENTLSLMGISAPERM